ncbi:MAG: FlgD immunoglobulin-like domain containing protein [Candidatus Eisenbacteria bacterium]
MEAQAYVDADGFQANNGEDSQVSLRWAFPEGVDRNSGRWVGFDLYRTVDGEAFPDQPLNAQPMQFYQYVDNAVVNGTTYRYRLITRYDDGASRGVEAVGTPYAASIGVDVTSVEATVRDFNDLDDGFTVTNRGAGTLRFNVFLADADVEFGDVQATYALPLEGPTDPEVVAEDPQEGASNVDVASISARRWENEGQEYVEFRLDGYGPWGDPTRDWGGVLLLDLDGNLDTAEDAFDLGWSETTNMGWEMGIIFGRFLAQVGLPGVAALVDAGGDTEPRILSLVDFPTDGSSLAFSVPLSEFGSAQAVQMQAVVAYSLGAPPLDYVPDLPEAASWLVRAPRHGQAVQGYQQRIDLALGNPDLPNGIYRAKLLVRSNDQDVPVLELPVTMTVDRGIPPVLRDVRLTPSIAGMQIAILPSGALPPTGVFVERAGGGDGEYARIAGPLAASPDGYYRAVDSSVRVGETYSYRFALDFSGDRHRTYDPVEQVFNPTVPTLQVEAFDYRLSGVMIRFTLDEMLEGSEIFVERSVADQNEYLRLNDSPLSADSSYTVSYLDATVEEGASYDYQFVVVPDGGPEIPYGPYAATYHAFPAELADLEASSSGEGIEVSFTVPSELDLLQGIWIERRPAAGGDFMARNEETLEPDVEGRVTLLDPWSVPWADGLEPGTSYEYRVRLVGPQSREHSYPLEPVTFTPPVPQELALLPSRPNPFRDRVLFRIDLPSATDVSLEVFDTSGRRVAVLMDGSFPAGAHQREWDGEATSGERVPSGVYFARLRAGGAEKRIRVLRVR